LKLLKLLGENFSGPLALNFLERISSYHRIQASPGFREAANFCLQTLREAGLKAHLLSYPAQEGVYFWSLPSFQEWEAKEAWCYLEEPREEACKLADFAENPISLIQRSAPFEGKAEVILLENGENLEDYQGLDLGRKIVLTSGEVSRVQKLAVEKFGAVGILYDGMRSLPPVRERMDLPDARQYTSFWWEAGEKKCFGFVLTPRQGEKLRSLLKQGQKVTVKVKVDSRFYDGSFEVVEATIPGLTDEWILVVSHLCHPHPSANDNASGAAVAMEAAIVLSQANP
jgi:aminopeptidase-like protein